jgi:predicted CoA-binding protein
LGTQVYRTLSTTEQKIDVVIFVTPPVITEKVLEEVNELKIKNVWMQP